MAQQLAGDRRHVRGGFQHLPGEFALPRGEAGLRLAVNSALAHVYRDGEIVAIFNKWFGNIGEPTTLLRAMFIFGALPE